jgi:hypothetical protein
MPVNEAAERIRKWAVCLIALSDREIKEHACTVARAWLEEHDPTPIDEAWLLSLGFEKREEERVLSRRALSKYSRFVHATSHDDLSLVRTEDGFSAMLAGYCFPEPGCGLPTQKTRGDLYRLMAALGIPGKVEDGK